MRESGSENQLVFQWLQKLQAARVFAVDNGHQCCRAEPRRVDQPFALAPHFYGCWQCGRYHFCRLRASECETREGSDGRLTCVHSGRLVRDAEVYVGGCWEAEQRAQESDGPTQCSRHVVGTAGRRAYTNSWVTQPHDADDAPKRKKRAWEDQHVAEEHHQPQRQQHDHDDEADDEEGGEAQGATERGKNRHDAYAYWREYYSFLQVETPPEPAPTTIATTPAPSIVTNTNTTTTFDAQLLDTDARTAVSHALHELVARLLRQHAQRRGLTLSRDAPQLVTRLVAPLQRLVCQVLLLVYNAPSLDQVYRERTTRSQKQARAPRAPATVRYALQPGEQVGALDRRFHLQHTPPSLLARALLLGPLSEAFSERDRAGRAIVVWRAPRWLQALRGEPSREERAAAALIVRCLQDYRDHGYWLRDFVQNGGAAIK